MKILFYAPVFHPSVGGLESVAGMLAEALAESDCTVKVVTHTPGGADEQDFPYEVIRKPAPAMLLGLVRWCDIFFQHNISLKGLWPLGIFRRRFVVLHHGLYARRDGKAGLLAQLKKLVAHFAENIAVSDFVASELGVTCKVIKNPYRNEIFTLMAEIKRDHELVFLGRLVSEKGGGLLIDALSLLKLRGITPLLTIIGTGPEEQAMRHQVALHSLGEQIRFVGAKSAIELPEVLNRHKILVVPSLVREGFGVVALEGIACGCAVIAANAGGLPEAVGPCGLLFPPGNAEALADKIQFLLGDPASLAAMRRNAAAHLHTHTVSYVAGCYRDALKSTAGAT